MAHEIHIKTADGAVVYPNAFSYGRNEGDLWVQVGDDLDFDEDDEDFGEDADLEDLEEL